VIDLVVAHGAEGKAFAVVTLGDLRFRQGPHHDLERERLGLEPERPFLDEAVIYPLPFAPDWVAVGDWDSDGDFDVVFAARRWNHLYWMAGDGQAHLSPGGLIELEGGVTAFAAGEVSRRDGLEDLVLAVNGESGPALLIFEHPEGALSHGPERIGMPAAVTSMAIDWFDGDPWRDIAAASGEVVVIVSGRDRRLVSTRARREAVPPSMITPLEFHAKILDVAAGFFTHRDHQAQLAVRLESGEVRLVRNMNRRFEISDLGRMPVEGRMLAARASGLRGHDLLLQPACEGRVEIFHAEASKASGSHLERVRAPEVPAQALLPGRLNLDTRDDLVLLGSDGAVEVAASTRGIQIEVNSDNDIDDGLCDATHCSLREAINLANSLATGSDITFDLPLGSIIEPTSALPELTQTVATTIDGTVGSGFLAGAIYLEGASAGSSASGLLITGGNTTLAHFFIGGFDGYGLYVYEADNNLVEGCRFGVGDTGGNANPNGSGLEILSGNNNTIGGTAAGAGNFASGNSHMGIVVAGGRGNSVLGNYIGTNVSGDVALPNLDGIRVELAQQTNIGSAVTGGANIMSGNQQYGLILCGSTDPDDGSSLVVGNIIGLDTNGTEVLPNSADGICLDGERNTTIGGTNSAQRNIISGNNEDGIEVNQGSTFGVILGNYIGTDITGLLELGNRFGIALDDEEELTIGGTAAGAGNLISGNSSGIYTRVGTLNSHISILGNTIGMDSAGAALGNSTGIRLRGTATLFTIGSETAPNTIAFQSVNGISIDPDCTGIMIGPNSIFDNGSLGIDLGNDYVVNANDALDADSGANNLQNFPEIEFVEQSTGDVDFLLDSESSKTYTLRCIGIRRGQDLPGKHECDD